MQNKYGQIDAELGDIRSKGQNNVRLRAIKTSGEECQTHNWQPQRINIGDKFQTIKLGMKNKGQTNCCQTESQNWSPF